jgi:DNA-binding transcriptional ArsR family regulator
MTIEQVSKCSMAVVQSMQMGTVAAQSAEPQAGAGDDTLVHPARDEIDLAAILHALSDPMRLRIVGELANGEERTCKSFDLPIVKSTCTHHFKVLREAGLIHQRVAGTTRVNSLRRDDLEARFPGLLDAVLNGVDSAAPAPAL